MLVHLLDAVSRDHEQRRPKVRITERSAENDHTLFRKTVDERRVLIPTELFPSRSGTIPGRPRKFSDEVVVHIVGSGGGFKHRR